MTTRSGDPEMVSNLPPAREMERVRIERLKTHCSRYSSGSRTFFPSALNSRSVPGMLMVA